MSNGTVPDVVGVVFDGNNSQISYLPSCSDAVSYSDYTLGGARSFDLRHWDYYKDQIKYAIPGWVFAGICLVLGIIFTVWLLSLCACTCCCGVRRRSRQERQDVAAWNTYKHDPAAAQAARSRGVRGRHGTWNLVFCAIIIILLLVMLAMAAWGLAEGLKATRHISDDFWGVIATARTKVANLRNSVSAFFTGVSGLQATLAVVAGLLANVSLDTVVNDLNLPLNLTGLANNDVSGALNDVADGLASAASGGNTVVDQIQRYGINTLANLRNDYKGTVDDVQNLYAPLVLGILFGVLVVLALAATVLLLFRRVRTGGTFLVLLWFWTVIYMIAGPGALHFGNKFTNDLCLYPENFTFKVVNTTGSLTPTDEGRVTTGLEYYFGAFGTTVTLDAIINQIYGIDLALVSNLVSDPVVNSTLTKLTSTAAQGLLNINSLNTTQQAALANSSQAVSSIITYFNRLQQQMSRTNYEALYKEAKSLLCCTLANGTRSAWIAYTVASAFAALLCIALSLRAFQAARAGYTSRPPPSESQFIVAGGAGGGPPVDSGAGSPHPSPHAGHPVPGYGVDAYDANAGMGGGSRYPAAGPSSGNGRRPSWPSAQPAYNGSYAPFKEGA